MKNLKINKLVSIGFLCTGLAINSFAGGSDDPLYTKLTMDSLELQNNNEQSIKYDGNIWIGYDINKVYLYSEGEKPKDSSMSSESQFVFSHAISPRMDLQVGVGYDKTPQNHQTWGVLALSGMIPYFIDTRTALLVGEDGNIGLRVSAEYEAVITQKLILVPNISAYLYTKDTPKVDIGKGLSNLTLNLKLQYNITKQFSPYIGVEWNKNYGNTYDLDPVDEVYAMVGFKFWL